MLGLHCLVCRVHGTKESLFSSGSDFYNFRGLLNDFIILLVRSLCVRACVCVCFTLRGDVEGISTVCVCTSFAQAMNIFSGII